MKNKLTIITATLNVEKYLLSLVMSLKAQTCQNFEWIVADGGSTDGTIKILESIDGLKVSFTVQNDFSIYDALNRAVSQVSTSHYCVIGADDVYSDNFVSRVYELLEHSNYDLIFGAYYNDANKLILPRKGMGWIYGMNGVGSSHSVGTVIKKSLHQRFGYYSKFFPIVADQFFIKKCIFKSTSIFRDKIAYGKYSQSGFSSVNKLDYQIDFFKLQLKTEKYKLFQTFIFLVRLFKLCIKK